MTPTPSPRPLLGAPILLAVVITLGSCGAPGPGVQGGRCAKDLGPERAVSATDRDEDAGCPSDKAVARGTVTTARGNPLVDASVYVEGRGDDAPEVQLLSVFTGARGEFLLTLKPGAYTLIAERRGFHPGIKRVDVSDRETLTVRFELKRSRRS